MFDITKDTAGNWNLIDLSPLKSHKGYFGDLSLPESDPENISLLNNPQASRSVDGRYIFFSWCDTDTSRYPIQDAVADPNGNDLTHTNYAPDLFTVGLYVDSFKRTPVTNWTANDPVWNAQAIAPHMADVVLEDTTDFLLPITVMKLESRSATKSASFHYFRNLRVEKNDFTNHVSWVNGPIGGPTSMGQDIKTGFTLFPNPASTSLHLNIVLQDATAIIISDLNGRKLKAKNLTKGQHTASLDIADIPAGMYLITLKGKGRSLTEVFVKH
jgi:hypothetical protein